MDIETHAHNHLLHVAVELGVPASAALLSVLVFAFYMAGFVFARSTAPMIRYGALGLGWGQLAHFFFGFGDSIPLGAKPGVVWWVSLALITAMYNWTLREVKTVTVVSETTAIDGRETDLYDICEGVRSSPD